MVPSNLAGLFWVLSLMIRSSKMQLFTNAHLSDRKLSFVASRGCCTISCMFGGKLGFWEVLIPLLIFGCFVYPIYRLIWAAIRKLEK